MCYLTFDLELKLSAACRGRAEFSCTKNRTWSTLPADHGLRTPPALFCSHQRPHCSENKHSTCQPEFLGRGSENLEQSTRLTAAA